MDDDTTPSHDDLLESLRRMGARLDPVPDHVTAAAEAALTWRTLDEELIELLHDSAMAPEAAGVRTLDSVRVLQFGWDDVQLELEVSGDREARVVVGQVLSTTPVGLELRHAAGITAVQADDRGRFRAVGVPPGPLSVGVARSAVGARRRGATVWLTI